MGNSIIPCVPTSRRDKSISWIRMRNYNLLSCSCARSLVA